MTHSESFKVDSRFSSSGRGRCNQQETTQGSLNISHSDVTYSGKSYDEDLQPPIYALKSERGPSINTKDDWDIGIVRGTTGSLERPLISEQAHVNYHYPSNVQTQSTTEGVALHDPSCSEDPVQPSCPGPTSFPALHFTQGPITLSIPPEWTYTHLPSPEEDFTHSPFSKMGPMRYTSRKGRLKQETTAQDNFSRSQNDNSGLNMQTLDSKLQFPALFAAEGKKNQHY